MIETLIKKYEYYCKLLEDSLPMKGVSNYTKTIIKARLHAYREIIIDLKGLPDESQTM
jgi:hypothetical protein